ncbi:MAG: hypothetical protein AAF608_01065 [Pseudomonadota bacterium]
MVGKISLLDKLRYVVVSTTIVFVLLLAFLLPLIADIYFALNDEIGNHVSVWSNQIMVRMSNTWLNEAVALQILAAGSFLAFLGGVLYRNSKLKPETTAFGEFRTRMFAAVSTSMFLFLGSLYGLLLLVDHFTLGPGDNILQARDVYVFLLDQSIRGALFDFAEVFEFSIAERFRGKLGVSTLNYDTTKFWPLPLFLGFYRMLIGFTGLYFIFGGLRRTVTISSSEGGDAQFERP